MKSIGENIKTSRLSQGLSQADAAKKLNISTPAFCKIETGQTDLNVSRLFQIAATFRVPVLQLLTGNNNELNLAEEIISLKHELAEKEQEINKLRKKVIELYERLDG